MPKTKPAPLFFLTKRTLDGGSDNDVGLKAPWSIVCDICLKWFLSYELYLSAYHKPKFLESCSPTWPSRGHLLNLLATATGDPACIQPVWLPWWFFLLGLLCQFPMRKRCTLAQAPLRRPQVMSSPHCTRVAVVFSLAAIAMLDYQSWWGEYIPVSIEKVMHIFDIL